MCDDLDVFDCAEADWDPSIEAEWLLALARCGGSTAALRRRVTNIRGVSYEIAPDVDLRKADLSHLDLRGVRLDRARLEGANISYAGLREAILQGARMSQAQLYDTDLERAVLRYADLSGAALCGANVMHASLEGADLSGADLMCTNLSGADLRGVNLEGAFLTPPDGGPSAPKTIMVGAKMTIADFVRLRLQGVPIDRFHDELVILDPT